MFYCTGDGCNKHCNTDSADGHLWINRFVRHNEHTCVTMNTHASQWTHMRYNEHTCVTMNKHASQWTHMRYNDHTCVTMNTHALQWPHMRHHEHTCVTMSTHASQWTHTPATTRCCVRVALHDMSFALKKLWILKSSKLATIIINFLDSRITSPLVTSESVHFTSK